MEHWIKTFDLKHPRRHDVNGVEQRRTIHPGGGHNTPQVDNVSKEDRKGREKHCEANAETG